MRVTGSGARDTGDSNPADGEGQLTQARQAATGWARAESDPDGVGSRWPASAAVPLKPPFESTEGWGSEPAPVPGRAGVPGFVSPTLALLATVATFEGYTWLNVIPASRWRPSAVAFALLGFGVAVAVVRSGKGEGRMPMAKVVLAAAGTVLAITVVAIGIDRPPMGHLLGLSDLAFALVVLGAVAANERLGRPVRDRRSSG